MLTGILAFFQAIPALMGGLNSFVAAFYNAKVQITCARIGGDVAVAKALVSGVVAEGQVRVQFLQQVSHSKFLMFLVGGFALPIMLFMAKCIVWDTMLGWGFTPTLHGQVDRWMSTIIYGIFGTGSVMAVGQMFFNRKGQ